VSVRVESLTGPALADALPGLADLRITVFRAFPYLYDGSLDYERGYLETFAKAAGAIIVGAFDGARLVGAATGAPLASQADAFSRPLREHGYDVTRIFYCGESVLLPEYRGRGLGHAFFDRREAQARAIGGLTHICFCAVVRPESHPARPAGYRPLDPFWRKRGYAPLDGVVGTFAWTDVGDDAETEKPMQYWMRAL
jgi:GNAT superfamily N-acetyltransferase